MALQAISNEMQISALRPPLLPIAYCLIPAIYYICAKQIRAMITNDQIQDLVERRDALRRYL
jgi:hypothetical protein